MNGHKNICPICNEGGIRPLVGKNAVEYKGQSTELDFHYSVCDTCGSEQTDSSQLKANKRAMLAFRKQVDGLLSGAEVRAIRHKLNLSQVEAAKLFGGGPVAFSKYESDDVAQSEPMDRLLRLVAAMPSGLQYLFSQAGLLKQSMGEWSPTHVILAREERTNMKVVHSSTPMAPPKWRKHAA